MPFQGQMYYEDAGQGRPVLFVHGWCMSSAIWGMQREAVAAQHRFLALDLRGHGQSALPAAGVGGFSGYAADIVHLVKLLDLQDVVVVGWSLGAQALLKAYPLLKKRIAGLVLVGATPRFSAAPHFIHGLAPKEAEGMRLKVRRNLARALDGFHRNLFVEHELDDPAVARQVVELLAQITIPSAAAAVEGLETLMEEEVMEEATQVSCPTLLLHGDQDRVCLPDASIWLEQAISGSWRISYAGCGHAPFLSRASQFNQNMLTFIGELHGAD
jgi:pimeloyl-ACP methyl ester carboxylesterase